MIGCCCQFTSQRICNLRFSWSPGRGADRFAPIQPTLPSHRTRTPRRESKLKVCRVRDTSLNLMLLRTCRHFISGVLILYVTFYWDRFKTLILVVVSFMSHFPFFNMLSINPKIFLLREWISYSWNLDTKKHYYYIIRYPWKDRARNSKGCPL